MLVAAYINKKCGLSTHIKGLNLGSKVSQEPAFANVPNVADIIKTKKKNIFSTLINYLDQEYDWFKLGNV